MKSLVLILTFFLAGTAAAEWRYSPNLSATANSEKQTIDTTKIGDEQVDFVTGPFSCAISKTNFTRMADDSVLENRTLACRTDKDTVVSVFLSCVEDRAEMQTFTLERSGKKYLPMIQCISRSRR